jgi:hypothetical protein
MKNIIFIVAFVLSTAASVLAQPVIVNRGPQTPTVRPELVFRTTKTGGAATDTVFSDVVSLKGTLYSDVNTFAADTLHRFVGYQQVTGDTCTYSLAYQECSPEGSPFYTTWTPILTSFQFVPNRARECWASVLLSSHFVRFRVIRAQGATASVASSVYSLFLYRY